MSTLTALELRKHDLRVQLVKSVKADGRKAMTTPGVYRKLLKVKRAQKYLRRT